MKNDGFYQIYDIYPYLKNPQKYKGYRPITCRSSWEIKFIIRFLDIHPSVLEWSSESIVIPYVNPIDKKVHRYFPDFWMKIKDAEGKIKEYLVEIKPKYQTQPPPQRKRKTKKYLQEVQTYVVNQAKWEAAKKYAKNHNMEFLIITEDFIPGV